MEEDYPFQGLQCKECGCRNYVVYHSPTPYRDYYTDSICVDSGEEETYPPTLECNDCKLNEFIPLPTPTEV